jgi:peptidoglycan hydrolase-like protein with peptidoglycan-binding domain
MALTSLAATPAKPKKHHRSTTSGTTHTRKSTAAASKSRPPRAPKTAGKSSKASKITGKRKGKKVRTSARSYQQAPTPERYREIQDALAAKGYYRGELNGEWGADSTDALKRFQADQNLMPDGKINSLSLIALGLGPKRLTASKSEAASPLAPPAPPEKSPTATPAAAPPIAPPQ